jgi:hypothetical protein
VEDRRLGYGPSSQFGVIQSGRQSNWVRLPTANYSTSSVSFNVQPPSAGIAINREILAAFTFELSFTGTAGANGLLLNTNGYDAPRAFPLAQVTNTCSATINNSTVSQNTYQVVNALSRMSTTEDEKRVALSMCPSMQDFYPEYKYPYVNLTGITNDPLQPIGQVGTAQISRGGFPFTVVSNTSTTAVVRFTTTEPLYLSPFLSGTDNDPALIGVQTLTLLFTLRDLSRVWSHSDDTDAGTITATAVTLPSAPEIYVNYITPQELTSVPDSAVYSYNNIQVYPTDYNSAVTAGSSVTISSANIQLNNIPRRIMVFARRSDATSTISTSDTFARIDSCSVQFDNQAGILGGASSQQLFNLSVNSGLNMSWPQWSKYTGSVLCLDVGRTILLQNPAEAPSLTATKQLQITVGITNLASSSVTYSLYIVTIGDGLMTISNGSTFLQNAILSSQDIIAAEQGPVRAWEQSNNWFGGDFFKKIKGAASKVGKAALGVAKGVAKNAVGELAAANPLAASAARLAGIGAGGRIVSKQLLLGYQ